MGIFSGAGVNVNNIPDDPFGFGKNYWGLIVTEAREPKTSEPSRDKNGNLRISHGMWCRFQLTHERYENIVFPFGQYINFPIPEPIQEATGIKFDAENNPRDIGIVKDLIAWFKALGFTEAEMDNVKPGDIVGRGFMAKMKKPKQNEDGFWEFGWYSPVPYNGSMEGLDVFAPNNNGGGTTNAAPAASGNLAQTMLEEIRRKKAQEEAAALAQAESEADGE